MLPKQDSTYIVVYLKENDLKLGVYFFAIGMSSKKRSDGLCARSNLTPLERSRAAEILTHY